MIKKIIAFLLRICISILIIGALFKIMHWPYSNEVINSAIIGIILFYLFLFIKKQKKSSLDYVKLGIVIIWCIQFVSKALHLFYFPEVLNIILLVLIGWWFVNEGLSYFTKSKFKVKPSGKIIFTSIVIINLCLIVISSLFKIMHWPYGSLILTLGMLLLSFLIIIDYFIRE